MSFHLDFSDQAKNDIDYHKKAGNKVVLKKTPEFVKRTH